MCGWGLPRGGGGAGWKRADSLLGRAPRGGWSSSPSRRRTLHSLPWPALPTGRQQSWEWMESCHHTDGWGRKQDCDPVYAHFKRGQDEPPSSLAIESSREEGAVVRRAAGGLASPRVLIWVRWRCAKVCRDLYVSLSLFTLKAFVFLLLLSK